MRLLPGSRRVALGVALRREQRSSPSVWTWRRRCARRARVARTAPLQCGRRTAVADSPRMGDRVATGSEVLDWLRSMGVGSGDDVGLAIVEGVGLAVSVGDEGHWFETTDPAAVV